MTGPSDPLRRIHEEWRNRVAAEYRSAALTAQVVHWTIMAALPEELVTRALRIVQDELDHARLSHDCLVALGGEDLPAVLDATALQEPVTEGILAALVDSVTRNFCLGETLAVPLFNAMRKHTTHPAARKVLTRVLKDEARHRQFGWDALDALLELDVDGVTARVQQRLPSFLEDLRQAYAPEGTAEPLRADERAAGLLDLADYQSVFWGTVSEDLPRRFDNRGIEMPVPSSVDG
ncbi:MAG: ferritin-like domain-containing protein [Myxococcales bacterium]|nr:ferritin-like domain-containing protein [Myxococcales bacterium]